MAKLPISRVVNVSVTRADRFPTRTGFGIPIIVTSDTGSGAPVDSETRVKVYGSIEEIADDWDASDEVYKAANVVFSQNPRPVQIKVAFVDPGVLDTAPSPEIADELDAVYAYDNNWYWLLFTQEFRGVADVEDAIVAWTESKNKQALLDSNDPLLENANDDTNVAARNKGAFDRSSVWYHTDPTAYFAAGAAAYAATRNFDQADSAYTLKFKRIRAIDVINRDSAAVQAITGFVPELGQDSDEGHRANAYVDIGGLPMVVEGTTLSAFVDEIHTSDWLIARTGEEVLAVLANNDRVAYTDTGIQLLVSAVEGVMQRAAVAGLIADVEDEETGELLHSYDIDVERVSAVPASQRRNRIAPDIRVTFRYAGAVHYSTVRMTMQF